MREPDLVEGVLHAFARGDSLEIERRTLAGELAPVQVTEPDGEAREVKLREVGAGHGSATLQVDRPAPYPLPDGVRTALIAARAGDQGDLPAQAGAGERGCPEGEAVTAEES